MKIKLVSAACLSELNRYPIRKPHKPTRSYKVRIYQQFFNSLTEIEAKIPEYLKYQIPIVVSPLTKKDGKIFPQKMYPNTYAKLSGLFPALCLCVVVFF